jgi:hypothetical protein
MRRWQLEIYVLEKVAEKKLRRRICSCAVLAKGMLLASWRDLEAVRT